MLDNNLFIANGEIFPLWRSTSTAPILGALNASWLPVNMFCRGIDYYLNQEKKTCFGMDICVFLSSYFSFFLENDAYMTC